MWKLKIKPCQNHEISICLQKIMWASVRGLSLAGREKNSLKKILLVKIASSTYWCICCAEKFLRDSCFPELTGNLPTSAAVGKGTSVPSSWEHHICYAGFVNYSTGKAALKGTLRVRKKKSYSIQQKIKCSPRMLLKTKLFPYFFFPPIYFFQNFKQEIFQIISF